MRRLVALAACVVACASACTSGTPGDITAAGQRVLAPEVQRIRDIAATGTYAQLQAAVRHLKSVVATELNRGNVTTTRAAAIDDAADELLLDATPSPSPSPSTTSPSTSASPTPSPSTTSPTPTPTSSPSASSSPSSSGSPSPGVSISVP